MSRKYVDDKIAQYVDSRIYILSDVEKVLVSTETGNIHIDFVDVKFVHSNGWVSHKFGQSVNCPPGFFAYLSLSPNTSELKTEIIDDEEYSYYESKTSYISACDNFANSCQIKVLVAPIGTLSSVNPNDVVCINCYKVRYLAPSLVDVANIKQGENNYKMITDWNDFDPEKDEKCVISASIGYGMYLDISTLDASMLSIDASVRWLDTSVKKHDVSIRALAEAIKTAGSAGGSAETAVEYAKRLSNKPKLWGQEFNGWDSITGSLKSVSYVDLAATASTMNSDNRPWQGLGKNGDYITLAGKNGVCLYTDTTNTHYVNIYSGKDDAAGRLKIGNAVLTYDSTHKALQLYGADGNGVSLYATGGISAYGATSDSGIDKLYVNEELTAGNSVIYAKDTSTSVMNGSLNVKKNLKVDGTTTLGTTTIGTLTATNSATLSNGATVTTGGITVTAGGISVADGGVTTNQLKIGSGGSNITSIYLNGNVLNITAGGNTYHVTMSTGAG